MYSVSTESHMPNRGNLTLRNQERGAVLIYDQYRYYHFLEKQDSHDAKSRGKSTVRRQRSGRKSSSIQINIKETINKMMQGFGNGKGSFQEEKRPVGRPSKEELARRALEKKLAEAAYVITPPSKGSQQGTLQFTPNTQLTVLTPTKALMKVNAVTPTKEPHEKKKQVMNAPLMRTVNNEKTTSSSDQATTTYITRIQYRRQVKSSPDVIQLMKTITAAMMQYNKTVQLLPFDDDDKNNSLITPRDIPDEAEEFSIYVPFAKVTRKGLLFMRFKIQANICLFGS